MLAEEDWVAEADAVAILERAGPEDYNTNMIVMTIRKEKHSKKETTSDF